MKSNGVGHPEMPGRLPETELIARAELQSEFLAAATSDNTRRAYRSAIRHFMNWGGQLPADVNTLINYLIEHAEILNPRTLSLKLTAISQWHRHQGFHDPCVSPQLRKVLLGIERKRGRPKQKASALLHADLEKIVIRLQKKFPQKQYETMRCYKLVSLVAFGVLNWLDFKWKTSSGRQTGFLFNCRNLKQIKVERVL